jgi:hypothetical protein
MDFTVQTWAKGSYNRSLNIKQLHDIIRCDWLKPIYQPLVDFPVHPCAENGKAAHVKNVCLDKWIRISTSINQPSSINYISPISTHIFLYFDGCWIHVDTYNPE